MVKKLDELPIATSVCAPRSKGTCDIEIGNCFNCKQSDPTKITVVTECQGKIEHSFGPEGGDDGDIYELQCDVCHFRYKIGVVHKKKGDFSFNSMFGSDERTGNRFMWLGIY
nr:hypothetical protein [Candidatus Sigynarchaeum springense]